MVGIESAPSSASASSTVAGDRAVTPVSPVASHAHLASVRCPLLASARAARRASRFPSAGRPSHISTHPRLAAVNAELLRTSIVASSNADRSSASASSSRPSPTSSIARSSGGSTSIAIGPSPM